MIGIRTAVIFLFEDAAKKGLSRFPHIGAIMPFLECGEFFDSDLYFLICLRNKL